MVARYEDELQSVAWKVGRNFTKRWHLAEKARPDHTLCERPIPPGVPTSRRDALVHDCEGCEVVRQQEVLKRLEQANG